MLFPKENIVSKSINLLKNSNDRSLQMLIFFVTSKCNARCPFCFNWQNLHKASEDLNLKEIEKMTKNMPKVSQILFSGGEPFLRDDLFEIISLFYNNTNTRTFTIPTNGSPTERIFPTVEKILQKLPDATAMISFSLDGLAKYHNKMRGIPNCFSKLIKSINTLKPLKDKYTSRLRIITNTVITPENTKNVRSLITYLKKNLLFLDDNLFEILRGTPKDKKLEKKLSINQLEDIYKEIRHFRIERMREQKTPFLELLFKLASLNFVQNIQLNAYKNKGWGVGCLAGKTIAVLDANGNFRHCELREPITNVRKSRFDLSKILNGEKSQQELKNIQKAKCWEWCTHICFINYSVYKYKKSYLLDLPKSLAISAYEIASYKFSK